MTVQGQIDVGTMKEDCRVARDEQSVPPEALQQIQSLYDAGLCLQAHQFAIQFGPFSLWKGVAERILAGRLAGNLGASRLAGALHWSAWRQQKRNPDLIAYRSHSLLHRRGPLAALEFLERHSDADLTAPPDAVAHYYTARAMVFAQFRDFATSEEALLRAEEVAPFHPWIATTRSNVFELQDRYDEALEAARSSLQVRPWYRPGVQALAHILQVLDRDEEALAFLSEAVSRIENMHVMRDLALLQQEHEQYDQAVSSLERLEQLAPLMEKAERNWLTRQRVTLDCLRQNFSGAAERAKQIQEPIYQGLAERIEKDAPRRRVRLNVPFVRQHHMTCAPATLSALSRFWNRPAEHLSIAEAICYDGTPAHSERHWAETHGWVAREFTVTWEAAVALLDRRIPFTLTTSEITSGHLQAAVGYDELRQTLWIRDPFIYYAREFGIKPLLEKYRATGPRGMALVPEDQRQLLEGLDLPDAELYDQLYRVQGALEKHRREEALAFCREMQAAAPEHRLTLTARRAIATYDTNTPALLECVELLLKQFPDDGNLHLTKLSCLRDLARREERLGILEKLCLKRGSDPVFWQQYAQELRLDGRHHTTAQSWIRWALRYRPMEPVSLCVAADILWGDHELAKATSRYRLAACLEPMREQFSQAFFTASRHLRQTDSALQFLKERHERLGAKSAAPTITYLESLRFTGKTSEAIQVLEKALEHRADHGALRLFAADFYGRFSQFRAANEWLNRAKGFCSDAAWHRSAAALADYQNDKQAALHHWQDVLQLEPLAHDAIRATANLLAETEGRERALEFLDQLCERFPFSCPLLELRIQWHDDDVAEAAIPRIRALLEINPVDAWAWRELALRLNKSGKSQEALETAQEAIRVEPNHSAGYSVRGDILVQCGRIDEARKEYREALRIEIDNEYALHRFVEIGGNLAGRKEALAAVAEELRGQVIFRNALAAYQDAARGLLPPDEVLQLLREAHRARPDLWQAWSVLINQLIDVGKLDEAVEFARQAVKNFPLLPRLWVDLARLEQARLDFTSEIAALEKALELSPGYAYASRQLAGVYERANELDKARAVMEQAVAANPLHPDNHGYLSHLLWKSRQREAAIERVQRVLRLQPGNSWAWNALRDWGKETGRPDLAADMARELTRLRAGEARSWFMLARSLAPQTHAQEIFAALDRAVALNPRFEDAHDSRAWVLTQLNRFDEAIAACSPPALQPPTVKLKIRAAWIETQRGNNLRAIALAKAALVENPDYYYGWQLLADCHVQANQLEEAVQAAEKMAALAPHESVPLGYLGDLKSRLADKSGAKAAFQRAFTLDPDYQYAGFRLFHMHVAAGEYAEADATLKKLSRREETPQTLSCAVELAATQRQFDVARGHFWKLCSQTEAPLASLDAAAKILDKNGQRQLADAAIEQQLSAESCAKVLGELWVGRQFARGRWKLHGRLATLHAKGELGRRAIFCYLDHLGEAANKAKKNKDLVGTLPVRYHLWQILKKHRTWLTTDVTGWGKVGYVLTCIGRPRPAIAWLQNWKKRPQAESWMLYNLVIMMQQVGRYDECRDIIRHAVTLRHEEKLYETFRLWAAFEEALAGNDSAAEAHLAALTPGNIKEHFRPVEMMTRQLMHLHKIEAGHRKDFFADLRKQLRATFSKTRPGKGTRYVRDGYKRFISAMTRDGGGTGLRVWSWWFYGQTNWLIALGLIAAIPFVFVFPPAPIVALAVFLARRQARK